MSLWNRILEFKQRIPWSTTEIVGANRIDPVRVADRHYHLRIELNADECGRLFDNGEPICDYGPWTTTYAHNEHLEPGEMIAYDQDGGIYLYP